MTKEQLKQFKSLKQEVTELTQKIDSKKIGTVVKSSSHSFPYCEHDTVVYGFAPSRELRSLQAKRNYCIDECNKIRQYLDGIDDSHLRRIFEYRYINGFNWQQIATRIGGGNSADAVRKQHNRFLSKQNSVIHSQI